MNRTPNDASMLHSPDLSPKHAVRIGTGRRLLSALARALPSLVVFAALGGIAYCGHRTGWTVPRFSALLSAPQAETNDWCSEHSIPESLCVECNPALLPKGREFGWCHEHGVPECPLEHPEVAQLEEKPPIAPADRDRTRRGLAAAERPENNSKCKTHLRRIQFASQEAVAKAGIEVAPVREAPIREALSANGEVSYDQTRVARLSTRAAGTVWRVEKKVGDVVHEGDILALIDAAEVGRLKSEFLQAFAQLDLKEKTFEALKEAYAQGAVPETRLREGTAAVREARIRLLSAQQALLNLGFSVAMEDLKGLTDEMLGERLRFLGLPSTLVARLDSQRTTANLIAVNAALDGVVVAREVVAGEVVDTTKPLFIVADTEHLWLTLSIRQEDLQHLTLGQAIRFRPDRSAAEATGTIAWISTAIDEKTRTVKVRADVDNRHGRLRANMFGPGQVILREEKQALVVPNEAIHSDGDCLIVFVRDKDFLREGAPKVFHPRKIRPGAKDDTHTEILAGVLRGELVATRGSAVLRAELLKGNLGEGCGCRE